MQVTVESAEGLERTIKVHVPAERVDHEVQKRLKRMAGNIRLDGFRPGKVPMKVVEKRYGGHVRQEVLGEVVQQTYGEALQQVELRPAGAPKLDLRQGAEGGDVEYEASFEIMPEFEVQGIADMKLERPVAEVTDEEIDKVLEDLRKQRATYNEADKAAEEGDQVVIDFRGTVDGEEFEGNQGEDAPVTIGANQMPAEFEQALVGLRAGDTRNIEYAFPENFPTEAIAGKTAAFETTVKSVCEPEYPALDDSLAEAVGLQEGGLQALRELIRTNLAREVERAQRARLKEQVTEALAKANELDLPKALVDAEIESLQQQMRQRLQQQGGQQADAVELPADLFEDQARRRVTLGLVMNKLIADNGIQVDQERVRSRLQEMVSGRQDPQEVLKQYTQNREMMQSLEVNVLEDQVIEWVVEQAQVEDKPTDLESLLNPQKGQGVADSEDTESTDETTKEG